MAIALHPIFRRPVSQSEGVGCVRFNETDSIDYIYGEPPVHSEEEKEAQVKKSSWTACTVIFDSIGGLVCSAQGRRGGAGTLG